MASTSGGICASSATTLPAATTDPVPTRGALQDHRTHPDQGAALDYPALHRGQVADSHLVL
jgi:hypothetical protein